MDIYITRCDVHGIKSTTDVDTAKTCVRMAREDAHELALFKRHDVEDMHEDEYHDDGTDCWVCCDQMVIDPYGIFDH